MLPILRLSGSRADSFGFDYLLVNVELRSRDRAIFYESHKNN